MIDTPYLDRIRTHRGRVKSVIRPPLYLQATMAECPFRLFLAKIIYLFFLGMEEILGRENNLEPCQNQDSAAYTIGQLKYVAFSDGKENWISACPIPCQQTSYDFTIRYFHETSLVDPENILGENFSASSAMFSLGYETLLIEEHVESLVYDVTNFLAAAGGNLGLFLGFSCMSVFYGMIKIIKRIKIQ